MDEKRKAIEQNLKFLIESTLTKDEFLRNMQEIMKFLVNMQKQTEKDVSTMKAELDSFAQSLKEDNGTDLSTIKAQCEKMVGKMMSEHASKMQAIDEKMDSIQDGDPGADADEEKVMEMVLAKIPPAKELEPETGETIVDKINELPIEEKDQIGVEHIKGLLDRIEKLEARPIGGGGRGAPQPHPTEYYDMSSQCDGATRIFTIPKNMKVLWLAGTDSPAGQYRAITDYTVSGAMNKTLTLDSNMAIPAVGATLHILYKAFF
jgi:hypothetical protein